MKKKYTKPSMLISDERSFIPVIAALGAAVSAASSVVVSSAASVATAAIAVGGATKAVSSVFGSDITMEGRKKLKSIY